MFYDYHGNISLTSLTDVITTFYYATAIPIKFSDKNNIITIVQPVKNVSNTLTKKLNKLNVNHIRKVMVEKNIHNQIYYYTNNTYESYLTIGLWHKELYQGMLIAGPILLNPVTKDHQFSDYYNTLPIVTLTQWSAIGRLLERLCNDNYKNNKLSFFQVNPEPEEVKKIDFHCEADEEVSKYYLYEKKLFMALLSGKYDEFNEYYLEISKVSLPTMCKDNSLRSYKNNFIYTCTIASQITIELGIKNNNTFKICHNYICLVEELDTIEEVSILFREMFRKFTLLIKNHNQKNFSPVVLSTITHINNHLTENITLEAIAAETHYTPKYISAIFIKEVGEPLVDYINKKKIEEAKKLLTDTNQTVSGIALKFGFCNQSYFSKVFKKFEGITPKKFRVANYNSS